MEHIFFCNVLPCKAAGFFNERAIMRHNNLVHKMLKFICPVCLNAFKTGADREVHKGDHRRTSDMRDLVHLDMDDYALIWSRDLESHFLGEFSFAVVQANAVLEDQSQVQTGPQATFVGVYDGHGGTEASGFVCDNLFQHLLKFAKQSRRMSEDIIRNSFSKTEKGFLRDHEHKPEMTRIGSCCLVGVITEGTLYVANLGNSRAVMGLLERPDKIVAVQLTRDHNAKEQEFRKLKKPYIIQVSRSIGDVDLKNKRFSNGRPVLSAEPDLTTKNLRPNVKFLVFASYGLWELLTNEEVVEIVHKYPRLGIAKRLLMIAMTKASKGMKVDIKRLPAGEERRKVHDDITIVVIFIDPDNMSPPQVSVRGFANDVGPPDFSFHEGTHPM